VPGKRDEAQRAFWDQAARTNAAWYVDTSLDFESPDMERFFATGKTVVAEALDGAPAAPPGRGSAVEIGCGVGRICLALAERGFERVIGVDISAEMIARAKELVRDDRVSFQHGDGATLQPIGDGSADLVLSFTVFQHIPDPDVIEGYIAEAGRILKPGGVFVFQWSNAGGSARWALRRTAYSLAQRAGFGDKRGRNAREFLGSRLSISRIEAALGRSGIELAGTKGLGTLFAWAWGVRRPA
jgi:SAM-dependent methyltransferase